MLKQTLQIAVLSLAGVVIFAGAALADNQLWINDSISGHVMTFGTGSSNKNSLQQNGEGSYINLPSLTAKWDKHTGQGTGGNATLTLTIRAQSLTLTGSGGATSTKAIGDIQFSTDQSNWTSLTGGATPQVVKSGLTNPQGQNQITLTVYFRIKASFNDTMSSETGAQWTLPSGAGSSNLIWAVGP